MDPAVILVLGATFLSVILLLVGISDLGRRRQLVSERLHRFDVGSRVTTTVLEPTSDILRDRSLSSFTPLDSLLKGTGFGEGMALDLARANMSLRVGEYLFLRILMALFLASIPALLGQHPALIALSALVGFYLPKMYARYREGKRVREFNDQLMDASTMIANSLKAGFSLVQGLELVSREMPPPMSEEFSQVLGEMGLGSAAEEALVNLTKRIRSYDVDLVVTAVLIQRQVGGNLAETLNNISYTIRQRIQLQNEIRALTSEARLSAYILGVLPIVMLVLLSMLNRSYMFELLTNPTGQAAMAVAAVMEVIGFIVLRRMSAIEM